MNRLELPATLDEAGGEEIEHTSDSPTMLPGTQTGLILVEQINGDMKLQSVAGDVHLKEVSGYIIVKTTGGSLVCTQCAGKLDFNSVGGGAQILQPALTNVNLRTTTGNILFDGDFIRTGLYTMKSGKGLVEVRFSGNDSFTLPQKERENLKKYLLNGGFILASPGCSDESWDASFRRELKICFPDQKLVRPFGIHL